VFESDGCYFDLATTFEAEWKATTDLFIVVDFELTGTDAELDEVLEFAAILVDAFGTIVSEFSVLVAVTKPLSEYIMELTGITQSDVDMNGRPLDEAMSAFLNFVGSRPIFIHHAWFDDPFLVKVTEQTHQSYNNKIYDTSLISLLTWPTIESQHLGVLAEHVGANIPLQRTLDYAKMTLAILMAAREQARLEDRERLVTKIVKP
jgi:DNA polymerase III alpha subunit (gram-positive type)